MADMTNIVDFNNSDGLPPDVVRKLNNNFWWTVSKILDPDIVMVSGLTAPDPRTDEVLWFKPDTGDLYIWSEANLPGGGTEWTWQQVDLGLMKVSDEAPVSDEQTNGEIIWYDITNSEFYILTGSALFSMPRRWYALDSFIASIAIAATAS